MDTPPPRKLLDQVRDVLRLKHYAYSTEESYVQWIRRFILFHNKRHPKEMGSPEIEQFLTHLAVEGNVAASTQNQALCSLLFLYREVLKQDIGFVDITWAQRPKHLPTVMTKAEVQAVLHHCSGIYQLVASLLYGSGLRLKEGLRLRVKDLDFSQHLIGVRDAKGFESRVTMLPERLVEPLQAPLLGVKQRHQQDLEQGYGSVELPYALARKYPNADRQWIWQYVFPSDQFSRDPRSGVVRRHHLHESGLQKELKRSLHLVNITKRVTSHTFRHSFATHLLQDGYDIRTVQELLRHKDVKTTMIYTHVLNRGGKAVRSPLDCV
jgi:integron integrase